MKMSRGPFFLPTDIDVANGMAVCHKKNRHKNYTRVFPVDGFVMHYIMSFNIFKFIFFAFRFSKLTLIITP